jgi:hypothetical protein
LALAFVVWEGPGTVRVGERPDPDRDFDDVGALGLAAEMTQRFDEQRRDRTAAR